jgi:hypothetical protein
VRCWNVDSTVGDSECSQLGIWYQRRLVTPVLNGLLEWVADVGRGSDRTTRLLRQAEGELQQATNTKTLCTVLRNTRRQSLWLVVLAGSMIGGRSGREAPPFARCESL